MNEARCYGLMDFVCCLHGRSISRLAEYRGSVPVLRERAMWKMLGLLAGMAMALTTPVAAQEYPTKPIRMIVASVPGGANDMASLLRIADALIAS